MEELKPRRLDQDSDSGPSLRDQAVEHRRGHYEVAKQHDDRLLWAIGGLAAAIAAFFKWLPGAYPLQGKSDMVLALGFLGASLIVVLANFQLAMLGEERNLEDVTGYAPKGRWPRFWRRHVTGDSLCPWIRSLNFAALVLFVAATIFSGLFAVANIDGRGYTANGSQKSASAGKAGESARPQSHATSAAAAVKPPAGSAAQPAAGSASTGHP